MCDHGRRPSSDHHLQRHIDNDERASQKEISAKTIDAYFFFSFLLFAFPFAFFLRLMNIYVYHPRKDIVLFFWLYTTIQTAFAGTCAYICRCEDVQRTAFAFLLVGETEQKRKRKKRKREKQTRIWFEREHIFVFIFGVDTMSLDQKRTLYTTASATSWHYRT